jgi:hypothetical protein
MVEARDILRWMINMIEDGRIIEMDERHVISTTFPGEAREMAPFSFEDLMKASK